jgi:hypothetical protein
MLFALGFYSYIVPNKNLAACRRSHLVEKFRDELFLCSSVTLICVADKLEFTNKT